MTKKNHLLDNFFLILIVNFAFFSFLLDEVYGISYSYDTPSTKSLVVDTPFQISLKVEDHKGLSSIEHAQIKLKINDFQNTSSISIKWAMIDGAPQVTVDNYEFVRDVSVIASSQSFLEFQFEFTPIHEIELRSVSVDVLERKLNYVKEFSESSIIFDQNNEQNLTSFKNEKDITTQHGFDRNSGLFNSYMQDQQTIAEETLRFLVGNKNIQNQHFGKNYNEPNDIVLLSRSEDPQLKNVILQEMQRAEELFARLYHIHYNFLD